MPKIDNIVKQLKNRKVFRSLVIYAGFAFVLIQVCDIVIPRLFLPEWIITFIIVLTIIGFPIIAILSWIYDIIPAEDGETPSKESTRPLGVYALTGLVLTVIGVGFWVSVGVFGVSFGGSDEIPSIGILMMENLGKTDEEFWSRGMTADLIIKVAGAGLIRVIPMKDILTIDKKLSVEEIASKLQVKYILTHAFHKKEQNFDLWSQLVNTENGNTLFANKISEPIAMTPKMVGKLANDIITSLKVQTKQDVMIVPTTNVKAYTYYLEAQHKNENITNIEDVEIVRGLLHKALELDDYLLAARNLLANTYENTGDFTIAIDMYNNNLNIAKKLGDKFYIIFALQGIGTIFDYRGNYNNALDNYFNSIAICKEIGNENCVADGFHLVGVTYENKGEIDLAMNYFQRSLLIAEQLNNKFVISKDLNSIGIIYDIKGSYEMALDYYNRSLIIDKENENNQGIGDILNNIGNIYLVQGLYDKALNDLTLSLELKKEIGDKYGISVSLHNMGLIYMYSNKYGEAIEYLEKSLDIQKELELGADEIFETTIFLYLSYKYLGAQYDLQEVYININDINNIEYELNYNIYKLLEDTSYFEAAYNQVQELADNLEPDVAAKFLSYPIPKAIVEEWEKVK